MILDSKEELEQLFEDNSCTTELNEESYSKSRYIDQNIFDNLVKYELNFEPYIEIAKHCLMESIQIMRSMNTNRFYIGFVNLGGHSARFEVRPVRLGEVENSSYIKKMLENYGQVLDWGIDLKENYDI
ncbi:MAG: hypothetical protein V4670_03535 [Bacteroidota bacterium]